MAEEELEFARGDLAGVMDKYSHLREWVDDFEKKHGVRPMYYGPLDRDASKINPLNLIYHLRGPLFAHVYSPPNDEEGGGSTLWFGIEPHLSEEEEIMKQILIERLLKEAPNSPSFSSDSEFESMLKNMIKKHTKITNQAISMKNLGAPIRQFLGFGEQPIGITKEQMERLEYTIIRDLVRSGPLEPLLSDEMLEDIHAVGLRYISMDHKVFGMVTSNIRFRDRDMLERYLRSMSERIGRPVSDSKPIIDGALLDGSRINIIYSDDVSMLGSSFTIRKFAEETISITQLIQWGTLSAEVAAYIWLGLENGMSLLVSGETASGKTTTLNAILPFIDHNVKIYSAEDTPEVKVRHRLWQR